MVAVFGALLVRFSGFLGPLLLAFILTYLLHPLVFRLSEGTKLSWRASVNVVFVTFIVLIGWLLTLAGSAILDQLVNLVQVVQGYMDGLPDLLQSLATQAVQVGPFLVDFRGLENTLVSVFNMDLAAMGQQLLSTIQPALGQAGSVLGALATSTFTSIGWLLFIVVITYFILSDIGNAPDFFRSIDLPGHHGDLRRLLRELGRVWNAYVRGQLALVTLIMISSFTLMSILGVKYALALALLTGLAKFVPYIGSLAMYITTALVTFFQVANYLGIEPGTTYMLFATIPAILMDLSFDNLVTPRFIGKVLGLHPAAILLTALVAANLLGLVGLLLAAPVLASLLLGFNYVFRKMLDLDPWPRPEETAESEISLARGLQYIFDKLKVLFEYLSKRLRTR